MDRALATKKRRGQIKSELASFLALGKALPGFFRTVITVEEALAEIKTGLDRREENFLESARTQIYEHPASPYRRLLKIAGCEFADLRADVRRRGLEGALENLARDGVYFTSDEFKGKTDVARGGQSFRVSPGDFQRFEGDPGIASQSSGSLNRPVPSFLRLDYLAVATYARRVFLSAHGLFPYSHAVYDAMFPSGGGVRNVLANAKLGIVTDRWFARPIPVENRLKGARNFLGTYLIVLIGKCFGPGFPRPQVVDPRDLRPILLWISERKREGKNCCITTAASNAVRIAQAAWEQGVSLEATKFSVSGEPFTQAKRDAIERVGAGCAPHYGFEGGGGAVGYGCAHPLHTDELHVNQHTLAVISHPRPLSEDGPAIHPLLFSTLHSSTTTLLLNVENGDYGTLEKRECGCGLEQAGFRLHLHGIRSFEKFTSEGMNYFYGDLFELLEKALPAEFGGGPGDYQLVEEEDPSGQTRLTLVVDPAVGDVEAAKLILRLQEALGRDSWRNRFQAKIWQAAGTIRVRRAIPHASARGKILPLHILR